MSGYVIDVPFLPLKEYARRTSQSIDAVKKQGSEWLPICYPHRAVGARRAKPYVNMVELFKMAEKEAMQ